MPNAQNGCNPRGLSWIRADKRVKELEARAVILRAVEPSNFEERMTLEKLLLEIDDHIAEAWFRYEHRKKLRAGSRGGSYKGVKAEKKARRILKAQAAESQFA